MRPLERDFEGLRAHALLISMFVPEPDLSAESRKWRSWLVHCLLKAARHYSEARNLILAQIDEGKRSTAEMSQGRLLPILDFALAMEDCVTSLEKVVVCINALESKGQMSGGRVMGLKAERAALKSLRNQQEHFHVDVAKGQTGQGPIFVTVDGDGEGMSLRKLRMSFEGLHRLIDASYLDISALFPNYVGALPGQGGVLSLSMSGTITEERPGHPPKKIG